VDGLCNERSRYPWCRRMDEKDVGQEPIEEAQDPHSVIEPIKKKK
jgi:hypothetical protein